jgi:putative colanic acid biosynthesis acetyltransferase WcaB
MVNFWICLREDLRVNKSNPKLFVVILYRIANAISKTKKYSRLLWALGLPYLVLYRIFVEWVLGIEIPPSTRIGPSLILDHGQSLVINHATIIGRNCRLRHSITIGCKLLDDGTEGPSPVIGDYVDIGSNSVIIGGITIGDHAVIGAGSVVIRDVPSGAVVVGNPARVVRLKKSSGEPS